MQKKAKIIDRAIKEVAGFEDVYKVLHQSTVLQNKSMSTFDNYVRRVALISIHFGRLPQDISDDEINEYLVALALDPKSPSRSSFKHMVYGLKFYFRHTGLSQRVVNLPSLKNDLKLPIILNRDELKELFACPKLLKHRIVLALSYSAGLRSREIINLKISDIDFKRKQIHIHKSKYRKDRIVPLSDLMAVGLKKYLKAENPQYWLFNGKQHDGPYSAKGLSWIMRQALRTSSITKEVNFHSLRHSYATHLLEEGVNIVMIQMLLGHANIITTMIYLHVAIMPKQNVHSPLDRLYKKERK